MTSTIQAELDLEELAGDNDNVLDAKARDESKEAEEVAATMKEEQAAIKVEEKVMTEEENRVPDLIAKVWTDKMVNTLNALEDKYTPHPLPYQGSEGVLHSADVYPPKVDFQSMGFSPRFLPKPEQFPLHGCSPDQEFYTCGHSNCEDDPRRRRHEDPVNPNSMWARPASHHAGAGFAQPSPFGSLPGLLTSGGVIQMPTYLFGYNYVSGTGRDTIWAMSAC